jgi:hypothetical protein
MSTLMEDEEAEPMPTNLRIATFNLENLDDKPGQEPTLNGHNALWAAYGSAPYSIVSPLQPGHPIVGIPPVYSPRNVAAPTATSMMASWTNISS